MRGFCFLVLLSACAAQQRPEETGEWRFIDEIKLDFSPMGIATGKSGFWVSDVGGKRVVQIDLSGNIVNIVTDLDRPMHLSKKGEKILIPQYVNDKAFAVLENGKLNRVDISELQIDGLASLFTDGKYTAFVDFYHHRIVLQSIGKTFSIGKKGHEEGQLFYPTDVEINNGLVYVADAYNNRVQVFDLNGGYVSTIGESKNIKVASGITVNKDRLALTDFEGNRIHVYDKAGSWIQTISDGISKPSDVLFFRDELFILNFGSKTILRFRRYTGN